MEKKSGRKREIVVMDGNPLHDWVELFNGKELSDGSTLNITQGAWNKVMITVYDGKPLMSIAPIRTSNGKSEDVTVTPDFILIRNQVRGPRPGGDFRNVLFGLMAGHVPSVNSLESIYMCLERPLMFAALKEIEQRVGHDKFPLINQNFYGTPDQMVISPELPCIVKVSHAHAGMGKAIINDQGGWRDLSTVLALHGDYCTAEPYIDAVYGIRVQRVGKSVRVMQKNYTGSGWKSQFGGAELKLIEPTEQHLFWAEECSKMFGGMDIFAIDALHGKDGKDYIIELNDCAIGILNEVWKEDSMLMVDMIVDKMNGLYCSAGKNEKEKEEGTKEDAKKEKGGSKKEKKSQTGGAGSSKKDGSKKKKKEKDEPASSSKGSSKKKEGKKEESSKGSEGKKSKKSK